jgi:hypothetical protein
MFHQSSFMESVGWARLRPSATRYAQHVRSYRDHRRVESFAVNAADRSHAAAKIKMANIGGARPASQLPLN